MANLTVTNNFFYGTMGSISGIPLQITDISESRLGFDIVSDSGNNSIIYIGSSNSVGVGAGIPMKPGESRHFLLDSPNRLWVVNNQPSVANAAKIFWVGQ